MVLLGVLYLAFEDFVLGDFSWPDKPAAKNNVSRTLVGIQIGLTLLSMFITRSSALSLRAKLGLPAGNQIMGWIVLGESIISSHLHSRILTPASLVPSHASGIPIPAGHTLHA